MSDDLFKEEADYNLNRGDLRAELQEIYDGWQDSEDGIQGLLLAIYYYGQSEAARATAEQRDSVIEQCAKAADTSMLNCGCTAKIRALKSQQDAAIESKPAYEDGYRDAWSEACPNCGHVKGEKLDSGVAK